MKKSFIVFSVIVTLACAFIIFSLATGAWERFFSPKPEEQVRTRVITPREAGLETENKKEEQLNWEEMLITKVPLVEGVITLSVLTQESEDGFAEEQFAAYRYMNDASSPVYITWIGFDETSREYVRKWTAPTTAARPETI